jgi:ATP-binding cassette, subfamily B, bacterial PglK
MITRQDSGMFRHWRKLLSMFTAQERLRIYLLLASTSFLAVVEVAGITSIMPFIAIVVDSSVIDTNPYLHRLYEALGLTDHRQFQFLMGAVSFVLLIVSHALTSFDAWFTFRFCYLRSQVLCTRLLTKYLTQPYHALLQRSPAELQKIIVTEVDRVVIGTLMASIGLFGNVAAVLLILSLLVFIDPWVTASTLLVLGVGYGLIFLTVRKRVSQLGEEIVQLNTDIVQRAREALDGAKEVKVLGREADFVARFAAPRYRASLNSIRHSTLNIIPIQALEVVAFGAIIVVTLYYLVTTEASSEALAFSALFAFSAYRLLPALQEIFDGINIIRYNAAALDAVSRDFDAQAMPATPTSPAHPLALADRITLQDVTFSYANAQRAALSDLTMEIQAGTMTCIMGPTGAGKSTAIDVVLGLLQPDRGQMLVDGKALDAHSVRAWQAAIGYVPQVIYLTDDTITRNIAFGMKDADIDPERVRAAAQLANIHEFITQDLAEGYDTVVGDRGLRLSGGQRQRIGIARALYHAPAVLVFDEATNALDRETEQRVLDALLGLQPRRTIVFVSHKASVARRSDRILVMARGRLVAQGSYAELAAGTSPFRELLTEA